MTKKLYFHLLIACVFMITALVYDHSFRTKTNVDLYAEKINEHLHTQEKEVAAFFDNKAFISRQLNGNSQENLETQNQDDLLLKELSEKTYTITIHKNDSLIFWTNNVILPGQNELSAIGPQRHQEFKKLQNGYYTIIGQSYKNSDIGQYVVTALIPIQYQFEIESTYLEDNFVVSPDIPKNIIISQEGDTPIISSSGETLCYIKKTGSVIDIKNLQTSLWLYLLALMVMVSFFNKVAQNLIQRNKVWQGAAFFITSVFGLRVVTYFVGFGDKFEYLSIFNKNFDTALSSSLGDLLINIGLLFWVMAFFHSEFPVKPSNHLSSKTKFRVTALNYLAIFGSILILTSVFKTLVFETSLNFDFDNIFDLNVNSIFAVTGLIVLLIAMFLFCHRMMMTIKRIGLSRNRRLVAMGLAAMVCFPFLIYIEFVISPVYLMLIAFLFVLVFDVFIDNNSPNFTWLLIWLVLLAAFPSILLFRYNGFKDKMIRQAYAKDLSDTKDLILEQSLKNLRTAILNDTILKSSLPPESSLVDEITLRKKLDALFTNDNYLFYNYNYKISAFNKYSEAIIKDQMVSGEDIALKMELSDFTSTNDVKYWSNDFGKSSYIMEVFIPAKDDDSNIVSLILEFQRQRREQSKVYTELLNDKPYKNLTNLNKYDFAVYKNKRRIDFEGESYGNILTIPDLPEVGTFKEEMVGNRSELIYNAPDDIVVVIGKGTEEHLKKAISLFSFIFSLLLFLVLIFAIANYFKNILPESVNFFISRKPSLRNRIQLSVIGMILVSFLFIGVVTVWFFNTSSVNYHVDRLERKTSAIQGAATHKILFLLNDSIEEFNPTSKNLDQLNIVNPMSKIHRLDVNLYNLNGKLAASSEEDIFKKGIISPQMSPLAFRALSEQKLATYTEDTEKIGNLVYQTSYVPLIVKNKPIAYLGLPYYSETKSLRRDVAIFMSTLLNVYVFLLLIASGLAILIANSITKPIAVIGENLKKLKLGIRNRPLEWKSKDEIGALIMEYNTMIEKLENSAEQLAQSEREGAWREMAKQVAHEIKNPLTPMKLSIQYLQHVFKSNPENIEPLLKRVSNTLIEQIDNLSQIASEFGNFAKMPRAENQNFDFNALVLSVYDLFHNGETDVDITINLPEKIYTVYADKNHLMRVLNNLLKNAQQSIPDKRKGQIEISVYGDEATETVTLKVSDNGTGIPEDKKDKVFVPNFTTKSSGTGLGLAISKNIIESVNGRIYFKSEDDKGTDFFVELPIISISEPKDIPEPISE